MCVCVCVCQATYWGHTVDPVTSRPAPPNPQTQLRCDTADNQGGMRVCVCLCVCVISMHTCVCLWHGKEVWRGIMTLVCVLQRAPFINLQSESRCPAPSRHSDATRKCSNQGRRLLAYWHTVCTQSPREAAATLEAERSISAWSKTRNRYLGQGGVLIGGATIEELEARRWTALQRTIN